MIAPGLTRRRTMAQSFHAELARVAMAYLPFGGETPELQTSTDLTHVDSTSFADYMWAQFMSNHTIGMTDATHDNMSTVETIKARLAADADLVGKLSGQAAQCVTLLANGLSVQQIADQLGSQSWTIYPHSSVLRAFSPSPRWPRTSLFQRFAAGER